MIVTSTVGKMDMAIARFEAPIMAYMERQEVDNIAQSMKNTLYNVKKSKHYAEAVGGLTGIGDFVATDSEIPYDSFEEGYSKTFIHQTFKKGIELKRELIDDARIIDMQNQSGALVDAANRTMEKFVHAPFNFCNASTFNLAGKSFDNTGADGLCLANVAHTSKTGKAPNQSNLTSYTLSEGNLKLAEEMMNSFVTDDNQVGNFCPDTLIVPYTMRNQAWELIQSTNKTETVNNNVNSYYNKYKVIVLRYLTDPKKWFLADSAYMKKCLFWIDRVPMEVSSQKDFNTQNWQIQGYMRYSLGYTDYRWVVANVAP